jgi:hypothetical protein
MDWYPVELGTESVIHGKRRMPGGGGGRIAYEVMQAMDRKWKYTSEVIEHIFKGDEIPEETVRETGGTADLEVKFRRTE